MDLDFIERLVGLVARSTISELEIESNGLRVRIAKQRMPAVSAQASPGEAVSRPDVADGAVARHSIRAPLTGVFYRSTAEGEPPLVSVGDTVEEGQKIGVLEAMKTFNVVEADRTGRIVEIAFEDRSAVQSGDMLFVLDEAG